MRKYISSFILTLTLPIGELHSYFSDYRVSNWIIKAYRPMAESWNVKYALDELVIMMYFTAWLLYRVNIINRVTVASFFALSILDTAFYFYNYKLGGFGAVYFWFIGFWLLFLKLFKK